MDFKCEKLMDVKATKEDTEESTRQDEVCECYWGCACRFTPFSHRPTTFTLPIRQQRSTKLEKEALKAFIDERLREVQSPQQIGGRLRLTGHQGCSCRSRQYSQTSMDAVPVQQNLSYWRSACRFTPFSHRPTTFTLPIRQQHSTKLDNEVLNAFIDERLRDVRSPQQIDGRLRLTGHRGCSCRSRRYSQTSMNAVPVQQNL